MGGTDSSENLVEITVTQHAMYHFCNYQLWGNEEDNIAWRMLGKQITLDEAKLEAIKLGSKKAGEIMKDKMNDEKVRQEWSNRSKKFWEDEDYRQKITEVLLKYQPIAIELAKTPEAIEKKKNTFKEIKHQQGEKNSQYGKMWITNGTKEGSYRISNKDPIPEGYRKGRVCT